MYFVLFFAALSNAQTFSAVNISHVVFDSNSSRLFVGASNHIYALSADLSLQTSVPTGPLKDSPFCSPTDCSAVEETIPSVNNFNKVLVIDNKNHVLIACGSARQGSCQRHVLEDISRREDLIPVPVAANDQNSSTVAFVGPHFGQHVLYVAATNTRLGPYRDWVPAISGRWLEAGPKLLHVVEKGLDSARVDISSHLKDYYLVRYVMAFASADFVYFATVQRRSHSLSLEEWGHISRLARVCHSDSAFNTYTEVTLQCVGGDSTDYTLLQSAAIVHAGHDLAADLNISAGERVLVGVFSTAVDHSSSADSRSALCVYSLAEIEEKFNQNIHMCYNGSVATRDMDYIAGNLPDCPAPGVSHSIIFRF